MHTKSKVKRKLEPHQQSSTNCIMPLKRGPVMVRCHQGPFQLLIGDKHNHVPGAQPQKRWHESKKRKNRCQLYIHPPSITV